MANQARRAAARHPVAANQDRSAAHRTTNASVLLEPAGTDPSAAEGLPEVAIQARRAAARHPVAASQGRFAAHRTTSASAIPQPSGTALVVRNHLANHFLSI